jgi:hypothetical protein
VRDEQDNEEDDEEEARRARAEEMRRAIDEAATGHSPPSSPREFTDRKAREAADERTTPLTGDGEADSP